MADVKVDVVTFCNLKGGQSKTTLASNYAHYIGGSYITNEVSERQKADLKDVILPERYFVLDFGDDLAQVLGQAYQAIGGRGKIIFDLGGFPDGRMVDLVPNKG